MSKYTEAEINRIINDCEILFVPEGSSVDDVVELNEAQVTCKIENPKSLLLARFMNEADLTEVSYEDNENDDFEKIYQESNSKKQFLEIPQPTNYNELLKESGSLEEDSTDYAVKVNTILRDKLIQFKRKQEALLLKISDQHRENSIFLHEVKNNNLRDVLSFKTSYLKCGRPFFKDAMSFPAPENDDYKIRKNALNEFFPFDVPVRKERWTTDHKIALVKGVKKQMIDYIKLQQSQKICNQTKTRGKIQKLRFISSNSDLNNMKMLELHEMIEKDYSNFAVNWNLISFNDLQSAHTVTECMGMWYSYLKPDINREPFSDEEIAIMSHMVVENNYQNWEEIASHLNKRTAFQTFVHFFSSSTRFCPANIRWTPDEDKQLLEVITNNTIGGIINWPKVGISLVGRNRVQCYNRYLLITKYRSEKKGVFSPIENRILLDYVAKYGTDFSKMPKELLPQRSMIQIKTHYNVALKHKGQVNPWTYDEDVKLMEFYEEEGGNWSKIAGILKTHNRLSCRTRYLTISKFLSKHPGKTLKDVPSRLKTVTSVSKAIEDDQGSEIEEKVVRSKAFGLLTFNEFREKNASLYSLLKTTYNYDLSAKDIVIDPKKFLVLKYLLKIPENAMQKKNLTLCFTKPQVSAIKAALRTQLDAKIFLELNSIKHLQFYMPPNFNSAMGLRAVVIKMKEEPIEEENNSPVEYSEEVKKEIEKFQKFYFSLYYWTAMMSKIDETTLKELYLTKIQSTTTKDIYKFINRNTKMIKPQNEKPAELIRVSSSPGPSKPPPTKKIKLS